MRFVDGLLVVSNTGFTRGGWRPGTLSVVDPERAEVVNRITTRWQNPTRLVRHGTSLYVVETGPLDVTEPGEPVTGAGGIEVLDIVDLTGADRAPTSWPLDGFEAPIDLALGSAVWVVSSAVRGAITVVDGDSKRTHTYAGGLGLGSVATWRDLFLVVDFNHDRLHVFDAAGEPWGCAVELGEAPGDLEGPQSVAVLDDRLYVVLAISGALRSVELTSLADDADCGSPPVETVVAPLGQVPNDLRAHGGLLYVVDSADQNVTAYDPLSGDAVRRWSLPPGSNPWHVDLSEDGRWMAVSEWASDSVRLFDLSLDDVTGTRIGGAPDEVPPAPTGRPHGAALADEVVEAPDGDGLFRDPRRAVNGVRGAGERAGGTDVFSLRHGETIVLRWSGRRVVDGPGPDVAVFENPFRIDETSWFLDPLVVEVSRDGERWVAFPHDYVATDETVYSADAADWQGFAGVTPVSLHEEARPLDPFDAAAGGDRFDLADLPSTAEADAIRGEGFVFLRLGHPGTNPDTGAPFPRDPVSNGPDIDGVYALETASE